MATIRAFMSTGADFDKRIERSTMALHEARRVVTVVEPYAASPATWSYLDIRSRGAWLGLRTNRAKDALIDALDAFVNDGAK